MKKSEFIDLFPRGSMYDNQFLDPEKFFRMKYRKALERASGLELFALQVIPVSILESFVKLDPTYRFKISPHQVADFTRFRTRKHATPGGGLRKHILHETGTRYTSYPHWNGQIGHWSPVFTIDISKAPRESNQLASVPFTTDSSSDSITSERKIWEKGGAATFIKVSVSSPPINLSKRNFTGQYNYHSNGTVEVVATDTIDKVYYGPMGARIQQSPITNITNAAVARANSLIASRGPQLLAKALPTSREYTLFRNVAELKDLPRTLLSLRNAVWNFRQLEAGIRSSDRRRILEKGHDALKDAPNQWLSYWFGWNTLYRDTLGLLATPDRIAKRINYLLSRSGKDVTSRSSAKWVEREDATFPFTLPVHAVASIKYHKGINEREIDMRVVVNSHFDFPPLAVPDFDKKLFLRKLGVYPTISDLYELVPWSWLYDWFTGTGNYLELCEAINSDPSLFNYGYISVRIKGKVNSGATYEVNNVNSIRVMNNYVGDWVHAPYKTFTQHESYLYYDIYVRKSVTSITADANTSDVDSLSPWQKSILGALFLSRLGY
jgi:hypothetical protein